METQLTVEQRLEAYRWVRENLTIGRGLCFVLRNFVCERFIQDFKLGVYDDLPLFFPEVFRKRPPAMNNWYWFDLTREGNTQREALLSECIAECEQLLTSPKPSKIKNV